MAFPFTPEVSSKPLDALRSENRSFTLDGIKSRLLQMEQSWWMKFQGDPSESALLGHPVVEKRLPSSQEQSTILD